MGVKALRDVTMPMLTAAKVQLDAVVYRRAHHVVSENRRTLAAADALVAGDWLAMGGLMYESHASMRHDFEISCPELDLLVELAGDIGEGGGVFGSRMTGGGFGGCTVSLIDTDSVDPIRRHIHKRYVEQTGIQPMVFATRPAAGAAVLQV